MKKTSILVVALFAWVLAACAPGSLEVTDAWSRPTPAGSTVAVYFTIHYGSGEADVLLGASSDVARAAEIHESMVMDESDTAMMMPVTSIAINAGQTVTFEPGSYHLMLIDLQRELAAGEQFTVTLHFEIAGDLMVDVAVRESN